MLWIGGDAYPLPNITSVRTRQLTPVRKTFIENLASNIGYIVKLFALAVALAFAAIFILSLAIDASNGNSKSGDLNTTVGAIIMLCVFFGVLAIGIIRRILAWLNQDNSPLYVLFIDTAGTAKELLASPDESAISEIARETMKAIDDPDIEYTRQINNVHVGDKINQYGNYNTGKIN